MAQNYQPKAFFRRMPLVYLQRYFQQHGVLQDFEFAGVTDTKKVAIVQAWLQLPETQRHKMEADFREIFMMSCEGGIRAILDEAKFQISEGVEEFARTLAELEGDESKAFLVFLDHPKLWQNAVHFFQADQRTNWRKRRGLPSVDARTDPPSIGKLENCLSAYFRQKEARGNRCRVEVLRRGELDYYFAYPEDYSQRRVEWADGDLVSRPSHPAFEVVFVYSSVEGTLDIAGGGPKKRLNELQHLFGVNILGLDTLPPEPMGGQVYELGPLLDPGFQFYRDNVPEVTRVEVKSARVSPKISRARKYTVRVDSAYGIGEFHEALTLLGEGVDIGQCVVEQVEIAVKLKLKGKSREKSMTVRLTHWGSCSLKYDEADQVIRRMLADSGIELTESDAA